LMSPTSCTDEKLDLDAPIGPSFSRLIPALKAGYRHLGKAGSRPQA
jgi:hypothetical protein